MQVDEAKKLDKVEDTKRNSNESSSDTDKTSGSLFNTNIAGIELSRIKELPSSFYKGYVSLDEFLSTTSTSDNSGLKSKVNKPEGTHQKRAHPTHPKRAHHHHARSNTEKKSIPEVVTSSSISISGISIVSSNVFKPVAQSCVPKIVTLNAKSTHGKLKGYAQDAIDEMNRQYDHNLCLDRFMNDIEQRQKEHQHNQGGESGTAEQERALNTSPSNSNRSSCSSLLPQSIEDAESGSGNSESIKSSKNGSNDKEENSSGNSSNSSKDDKPEPSKDARKKASQSVSNLGSEDSTSSASAARDRFSSMESGVVVDSSSTNERKQTVDFNANESASCDGEKTNNYKGGKLGRKRKRGYIYNPKPVIEKPPKQFVPDQAKDRSYWDKRQRNNEAARRSREMRRLKEKETHDKLVRLKKENEALRVAITLLIQKNENLEIVIDEFEKVDNSSQRGSTTVPVTC